VKYAARLQDRRRPGREARKPGPVEPAAASPALPHSQTVDITKPVTEPDKWHTLVALSGTLSPPNGQPPWAVTCDDASLAAICGPYACYWIPAQAELASVSGGCRGVDESGTTVGSYAAWSCRSGVWVKSGVPAPVVVGEGVVEYPGADLEQ
jgi:hypothetical protein